MSMQISVVRARCEDCGWEFERSLDAGENLNPEENQTIAARVTRSHAFKCKMEDREGWGEIADVELDMTGDL